MHRRELFRLLAAGAAIPALNSSALAMLREAQAAPSYALRTLDPHQNATVITMSETILPQTDTPGARGAKVNEFIDVILTDWATEEDRKHFLAGLATVDERSNELYAKPLVDCTPAQQETLLRALDDEWVRQESQPKPHMTSYENRDQQLHGDFFGVFKRLTLTGYYTSEIGFTQELKKVIIPGSYKGCIQIGDHKV